MSELYELPNGWEWKTLNDIFLIERGGSPRPIKDYITDDKDGVNWIKIGDATKGDGKYIDSTAQKIKQSGLKKSRLVIEGDFIMSNSMSFGRPYIVKTKGAIHDGWLLMRDKLEDVDKDFFYFLLSSNYMYQQFASKASGTTVKNLNINLVKSTNVPLPPLTEQQRIVLKLDKLFEKIDKAIALHQQNMDEADVFVGSVLNEVFGELEERYEIKTLNNVCNKITDGTHKSPKTTEKGYPYITVRDVTDKNIIDFNNCEFVNEVDFQILKNGNCAPMENDVLFSKDGTVGKVTVVDYQKDFVILSSLAILRPSNELNSFFLFYTMKSPKFFEFAQSKKTGAAIKRVVLRTIKEFELPLPPLPIQQKVVTYLDEITNKIEKVKSVQKDKMDSLTALKASLLDKAFRGEL